MSVEMASVNVEAQSDGSRTPTMYEGQQVQQQQPTDLGMDLSLSNSLNSVRVDNDNSAPVLIFLARDYTRGLTPRFADSFPNRLVGLVEERVFRETIDKVNSIFEAAEKRTTKLMLRNILSCLSAYTLELCLSNPYDKHLEELTCFINQQNEQVYAPLGLVFGNPLDRGLRVIEIRSLP
jgi:hypothetical protein